MLKFNKRQKFLSYLRFVSFRLRGKGLSVGKNVYVGKHCCICSIYQLSIGNNVYIGKNVTIEVEGKIGDGCLIANNVGIIGRDDHDKNFSGAIFFADTVRENKKLSHYTVINNGVWLGYGSIVLSGVEIGENVIVASGAVVTKNIPENCIVAGNPARVVGYR